MIVQTNGRFFSVGDHVQNRGGWHGTGRQYFLTHQSINEHGFPAGELTHYGNLKILSEKLLLDLPD
ncbi:hypothetical protein D3C80_1774680 [compost metagenome]